MGLKGQKDSMENASNEAQTLHAVLVSEKKQLQQLIDEVRKQAIATANVVEQELAERLVELLDEDEKDEMRLAELEMRIEDQRQLLERRDLELGESKSEMETLEDEGKRFDQQAEELEHDLQKAENHIAEQAAKIDDLRKQRDDLRRYKLVWEKEKTALEQILIDNNYERDE